MMRRSTGCAIALHARQGRHTGRAAHVPRLTCPARGRAAGLGSAPDRGTGSGRTGAVARPPSAWAGMPCRSPPVQRTPAGGAESCGVQSAHGGEKADRRAGRGRQATRRGGAGSTRKLALVTAVHDAPTAGINGWEPEQRLQSPSSPPRDGRETLPVATITVAAWLRPTRRDRAAPRPLHNIWPPLPATHRLYTREHDARRPSAATLPVMQPLSAARRLEH